MVSACAALEYSCWAISIVLVLVLVVLGCTERKGDPAAGKKTARIAEAAEDKKGKGKSARRAYNYARTTGNYYHSQDPSDTRDDTKTQATGSQCDHAFQEIENKDTTSSFGKTYSWLTGDEKKKRANEDNPFSANFDWNEELADPETFKPVDKAKATAAANILAGESAENGRGGKPKASIVGLNPLMGIRADTAKRAFDLTCRIPFGDTNAHEAATIAAGLTRKPQ